MSEENTNVEGTQVNSAEQQTFSLDDIKRLSLEDESVKNWLQSEKDRNFTKGLETWKEKTLPQLLEEEIKKRYPEETEEQRELRELKSQIEQIKKEKERESLRAKAKDFAIENKLPSSLVDFFIGSDAETTTNNLQILEKVWNEALKAAVGETFKQNGREPHKNTQSTQQINNPFKSETFNLTEQTRLYKENPELAAQLKKQAGK